MLDNKARLDILLRMLARKNRTSVDDDINTSNRVSRGFINKLVISLNRVGIISNTEYTEALERIW